MDASGKTIIDADAHVTEPRTIFQDYIDPQYRGQAPRIVDDNRGHPWMSYRLEAERIGLSTGSEATSASAPGPRPPGRGLNPADRLADMDSEGIDAAVLYPSLALSVGSIEDPAVAAACCRAYNRWLSEYCSVAPHRLIGVAAVPFQHPPEAVQELGHATEKLGMRAVFVRPNPHLGRRIDHPAHDCFWDAVQSTGCPVGIHEGTTTTMRTIGEDRYPEPFRLHMISHVVEQMLACMDMIAGGVLERFPRLRVLFLESGGGWLCSWLSRFDHQFCQGGAISPSLKCKPSEYFQRQCWISFDPDDPMLKPTVKLLGSGCIVWASDYPHFDCIFPGAVDALRANLDALPEADRINILGANVERIYRLV